MLLDTFSLVTAAALCLHILGLLSAIHAVMTARVSQSAVAWSVGLVSFPYISLPLYWLFGIYQERTSVDLKAFRLRHIQTLLKAGHPVHPAVVSTDSEPASRLSLFAKLGRNPVTYGNRLQLLIDGEATFAAIFAAIDAASEYVLVESFIVNDDELGRLLHGHLLAKAKAGVKVYLLYDKIGSHGITKSYVKTLRQGGVNVEAFRVRERVNRFQVNFRNHRKIVVVDGACAFIGGHNVGDEYMGKSKRFGHWRDTHVRIDGPAVAQIQSAFAEDWYLVTEAYLNLNWQRAADTGKDFAAASVVVSSDPLRMIDTAGMSFTHAINLAKKRLWIASPYFIPDEKILAALKLKSLEGVDVRIILPDIMDHVLVYFAGFSYLNDLEGHKIAAYRYRGGFLHEKVVLVDDDICGIGTANLDNRSFHLNFEIMIFTASSFLCKDVEAMLASDMARSRVVDLGEFRKSRFAFRLLSRVSRLFSPIL